MIFKEIEGTNALGKPIIKDRDVKYCVFCPKNGHPFIFPEDKDAKYAVKTEKGYKCLSCQQDEIDKKRLRLCEPGSPEHIAAVQRQQARLNEKLRYYMTPEEKKRLFYSSPGIKGRGLKR